MSFPFGGHPTLRRFVEWLVQLGCTATVFVKTTKNGRSYQVLRILNPKGGHVEMAEPDFDELMMPTMVSQFQRRLCIRTPFAELPQPTPAETQVDKA